jgi:antitoxin component HigA of HigAB toxin-antitoxin module
MEIKLIKTEEDYTKALKQIYNLIRCKENCILI